MKYIQKQPDGCVFCDVQAQRDGPDTLVVFRGQAAFVILNRYPYTSGHLMVVANTHLPSLEDLAPQIRAEMMELVARCMQVLRKAYRPEGFNIGANIGEVAGAGVAGHVHIHVIPRWKGDANFMSTAADTRVLPESLEESYGRVLAAW